jgi:2-keto-4-pentenoate hydratase
MTNPGTESRIDVPVIAAEAFGVLDTGRQIAPFSSRHPAFSLDDAYRVTAAVRRLRETRGEKPVAVRSALPTARRGLTTRRCGATSTTAPSTI